MPEDDRSSSFRLEIAVSVGYHRKRTLVEGKWEGPLITLGLLIGSLLVVVFVFVQLARILGAL